MLLLSSSTWCDRNERDWNRTHVTKKKFFVAFAIYINIVKRLTKILLTNSKNNFVLAKVLFSGFLKLRWLHGWLTKFFWTTTCFYSFINFPKIKKNVSGSHVNLNLNASSTKWWKKNFLLKHCRWAEHCIASMNGRKRHKLIKRTSVLCSLDWLPVWFIVLFIIDNTSIRYRPAILFGHRNIF